MSFFKKKVIVSLPFLLLALVTVILGINPVKAASFGLTLNQTKEITIDHDNRQTFDFNIPEDTDATVVFYIKNISGNPDIYENDTYTSSYLTGFWKMEITGSSNSINNYTDKFNTMFEASKSKRVNLDGEVTYDDINFITGNNPIGYYLLNEDGSENYSAICTELISIKKGNYELEITPDDDYFSSNGWSGTNVKITVEMGVFTGDQAYYYYYGPETQTEGSKVFRLYNPNSTEHLYTTDAVEMDHLSKNGWDYEGTGWVAPTEGTPIYRLYNPYTGGHLYTSDQNEIDTITKQGWTLDNAGKPLMYSGGDVPIYRLYNPYIAMHLLTRDKNEYDVLANQGWNQEGIALYGLE